MLDPLRCAIIDDDPDDCWLVARYVDRASAGRWTSESFTTYADGRAALSSDAFDVAFVDLNLDTKSGIDLLREVERECGGTPIIMMSSDTDESYQDGAIAAGAHDFIPKDELNASSLRRAIQHAYRTHTIENTLRRSAETARTASDAKSSFLACMRHDLRTPLNAIIGFSDVLVQGAVGPVNEALAREYASYINQSGKHLLDIINTVLDLSKIEEQKFSLNKEWLSLQDLIFGQVRLLSSIAAERAITIRTQFRTNGTLLLADRRALGQILTNLLSNAIKFSHAGGEIVVTTAPVEGGLELRIADQGVGMTGPELKLALTPFGQATRDARLARDGTGLGLTIVQALVEEHGGKLEIDTRKGAGTAVRVIFPDQSLSDPH